MICVRVISDQIIFLYSKGDDSIPQNQTAAKKAGKIVYGERRARTEKRLTSLIDLRMHSRYGRHLESKNDICRVVVSSGNVRLHEIRYVAYPVSKGRSIKGSLSKVARNKTQKSVLQPSRSPKPEKIEIPGHYYAFRKVNFMEFRR